MSLLSILQPPLRRVLTAPMGALRPAGGSAPVWTPAELNPAKGIWLRPGDLSTGFQDAAGTVPQTAAGQPTGRRVDKFGLGNNLTQSVAAARPMYDVIGGIASEFTDGVDDGYAITFAGGTLSVNMDCFVALKTTDTSGVVLSDANGSSRYFGAMVTSAGIANSNSGTPTYWVNGVQVTGGTAVDRAVLQAAVATGAWVVLEVRNLDLSLWTGFNYAAYSGGFHLGADMGGLLAVPAETADNRNKIRTWLGNEVQLSL